MHKGCEEGCICWCPQQACIDPGPQRPEIAGNGSPHRAGRSEQRFHADPKDFGNLPESELRDTYEVLR